uniref:hypothetical protein n=1 Tax=Candidatus Enterococcus willemsii TaxID=1857215 RepID=UPI00403F6BF6
MKKRVLGFLSLATFGLISLSLSPTSVSASEVNVTTSIEFTSEITPFAYVGQVRDTYRVNWDGSVVVLSWKTVNVPNSIYESSRTLLYESTLGRVYRAHYTIR